MIDLSNTNKIQTSASVVPASHKCRQLSDTMLVLLESLKSVMYNIVAPTLLNELSHCFRRKYSKPSISNLVTVEPSVLTSADEVIVLNISISCNRNKDTTDTEQFCATMCCMNAPLCRFCGSEDHSRTVCPARYSSCDYCRIRGHFSSVCERKARNVQSPQSPLSTVASFSPLSTAIVDIKVDNRPIKALIDTGSTQSFINSRIVQDLGYSVLPVEQTITLASAYTVTSPGTIVVSKLEVQNFVYHDFKLTVLSGLCCDALIGHDLFSKHQNLIVNFGGGENDLHINSVADSSDLSYSFSPTCNLVQANIDPPPLFHNLSSDCYPIACKSRRYSDIDRQFIREQVSILKSGGVVEESHSPWRAQVLVTRDNRHKPRLVIDYSRTINKFTFLDAYPLPRIDDMAFEVSKYKFYSTLDLKSAYHQIPIAECDREYTAFEADGELLQFTRIPFGVTNGVSAFQRTMDNLIKKHHLKGTFAYMDNITIGGETQKEHDANLQRFHDIVSQYSLTLNHDKSVISVTEICMLGYLISHRNMKPDPERMRPLFELPIPTCSKSLKRALGLFSYYSQWVEKFSDKIHPLSHPTFPLSKEACEAFSRMKHDILLLLLRVLMT